VTVGKPAERIVLAVSVNNGTWLFGRDVGDVDVFELLPVGDYDVTLRSRQWQPLAHDRVTVTAGAVVPVTLTPQSP
jgi:hypothetical protein